jgi:hypothetical protein
MVCPSRKNLMVCRIVQDKRNKNEKQKEKDKEIITEEEHQKRMNKLKELGLIK